MGDCHAAVLPKPFGLLTHEKLSSTFLLAPAKLLGLGVQIIMPDVMRVLQRFIPRRLTFFCGRTKVIRLAMRIGGNAVAAALQGVIRIDERRLPIMEAFMHCSFRFENFPVTPDELPI